MNDRFIKELRKLNFDRCEAMLKRGWDLNKTLDESGENYLSDAIFNAKGKRLVPMIRFCIDHGFDVGKMEGRFGAECLKSVCFSSFDQYLVDAGRELIRAGAVDVETDSPDRALDIAITERDYQERFEADNVLTNYYEAYIRMLEALREGNTEADFWTFHNAEGKTITHVYASKNSNDSTFTDTDIHKNTYTATLYFEYNDGFLAVDRYNGIWTSGHLPFGITEDVSKKFKDILGRSIKNISFVNMPKRRFPEVWINMDSGRRICFGTNFEETNREDEHRAYFRIEF